MSAESIELTANDLYVIRTVADGGNRNDVMTINNTSVLALLDMVDELTGRLDEANTRIASDDASDQRVRALHTRRTRQGDPDHCNHCGTGFAPSYIYPCPTIRALDGGA